MSPMEHESIDLDAWRLLPWLANGTLEGEDLEGVLDHLKHSARCREELLFLSELRFAVETVAEERLDVPEERLADLMDRIDAHERKKSYPASGAAASRWLAQAALVVLLAGALFFWKGGRTSDEVPQLPPQVQTTQFQTLSSDSPAGSGSFRLWLIPESGLTEPDLRRLVLEFDAEIVGGPTEMGAYTLGWTPEDNVVRSESWLDELAARLRADERVALAEPVRGP